MAGRTVDPYENTSLIDSRAPRTNQAVIGTLALLAFIGGLHWLVALLAAQLIVGLTFGRRFCLPCVMYFELIQPRIGEGRIEDSRPPRFANVMGAVFLTAATAAFIAGLDTLGWVFALIVAALALFAALSGICVGCELYVWLARLRGLGISRYPSSRIDLADVGLSPGGGVAVVGFSTPYCAPCRAWEQALTGTGVEFAKIDLAERPELARKYDVRSTPLLLAVERDGSIVERFGGEPTADALAGVLAIAATG